MLEMVILILLAYFAFRLAWWLVKTAFVLSAVALLGLFLWTVFLV